MTSLASLLRHPRLRLCRAAVTRDWWLTGSRVQAERMLLAYGSYMLMQDG